MKSRMKNHSARLVRLVADSELDSSGKSGSGGDFRR